MKKLLNTLFVTSEDAYLTLDGENVVVNREKQVTARFPLHALAGIISFSYAGASPALMGACAIRAGAWIEIFNMATKAVSIDRRSLRGATQIAASPSSRPTSPDLHPFTIFPNPTKTFAHVMTHVL